MKTIIAVFAVACLFFNSAHAHRDRRLPISADGSIEQIPKEFGPVKLTVTALGTNAPFVTFSVRGQITALPACQTRHIRTTSLNDIKIAGSWYHDDATMPYYVNVTFLDPGNNRKGYANSSYEFLFNLRTSRLISAQRFITNKQHDGGRYSDVPLTGCL
jgi:hypothetical protein